MRVDLPSSTEPHVTRRSSSVLWAASEVANALPIFHRRFAEAVVGAGLAALGHSRCRDLLHDLLDRRRPRLDASRAGHVADRAEADGGDERILALHALDVRRGRIEHPVAAEDLPLVREIDRRQLELLPRDVLPDVELGPVRDREDAHVLALADSRVVEVPQLGPLRAGVPLAEVVAEGEDPLLRPAPLLVAARAADCGVEAVLLDRVEQRRRLQAVARGARAGLLDDAPLVDRLLHRRDDEPLPELRDAAVAVLDRLGEVVPRVDVHDRERELARPERFLGEPQEDDRVLAAGEEQHRPLPLGRDLAKDVNGLRLELVEVRERRNRAGGAHNSDSTRSGSRLSSSSRSSTVAADSVGVRPEVSSRSSGSSGSSYGAETPVNSSISPANAAA